VLFGHSHRWFCETFGETMVVNPGSAGRPRFSDAPSVAILACGEVDWRIRRYDLPWPPVRIER
jgi:predicted phosphodiesterase